MILLFFFIACVGGCWMIAKGIANALFPEKKQKDPYEYLKYLKQPPVINNHYHTHVHHHQNLTVIDDETKQKVLEIKKATN